MKILAFAASTSRKSINKVLVTHAARRLQSQLKDAEVEILDLNDFEMPLYSIDRENEGGIPDHAHRFRSLLGEADALLISFAEHNGSYAAAYKNIFDWTSRIDQKVFQQTPVVMLSTSPGKRGGATVLQTATGGAPHFAADLVGSLAVPRFHETFNVEEDRLNDAELDARLGEALGALAAKLAG